MYMSILHHLIHSTDTIQIMVSHSFDALWVQYRTSFNLSRDQTRRYRPDDDLLEFEEDSDDASAPNSPTAATDLTEDNSSESDAVSVPGDNDSEHEAAISNTNEGTDPITLTHDLSPISEEGDESSEIGDMILDSDGYVIARKEEEGWEAAKTKLLEDRAAEKAAKRKGKQPQEPTYATDSESTENETTNEQPTVSANAKAKRPGGKTPAALKPVRSAIKKGKKPTNAAKNRKPRARTASASRATTPAGDNPSRGNTPNVQTRSRANTPAAEEIGASNPVEVKKTQKKRKLDDVEEGSEPEEDVLDGEDHRAKKTKRDGSESAVMGAKGQVPKAKGGKKGGKAKK